VIKTEIQKTCKATRLLDSKRNQTNPFSKFKKRLWRKNKMSEIQKLRVIKQVLAHSLRQLNSSQVQDMKQ
jgi:hypothetical protein